MPTFGKRHSGPEITALYRMSDAISIFRIELGLGLPVNPKTGIFYRDNAELFEN
jgi:hypothetical protein